MDAVVCGISSDVGQWAISVETPKFRKSRNCWSLCIICTTCISARQLRRMPTEDATSASLVLLEVAAAELSSLKLGRVRVTAQPSYVPLSWTYLSFLIQKLNCACVGCLSKAWQHLCPDRAQDGGGSDQRQAAADERYIMILQSPSMDVLWKCDDVGCF